MPKIYSAGNSVPAADLNGIVQVAGGYAASVTGNDSYVISVTPTPGSYTAGDVFYFKADVANTGAATLNVNTLGAKTIKKFINDTLSDLDTGDIQAGQLITVQYDGTYFQLIHKQLSFIALSASDNLKHSADTERTIGGGSYSEIKKIRVNFSGTIRVKFDLKNTGGFTTLGKIYVNGSPVGTERSTSSTSYVTYSEDIVINAHDLIQLFGYKTGDTANTRNFRIYYDKSTMGEAVVLVD